MPLPKPQRRQHQHGRTITSDAYLRDDGLWDIEVRMTDIKSSSVDSREHGYVAAGEAFHDIQLRVTIDAFLKIHEVQASIDAAPFEVCPNITDAYKKLIGINIRPGWRVKAKELVGGASGCTHLNELLPVVATTAFQALWSHSSESTKKQGYKLILDSCHVWSRDGELVNRLSSEGSIETTDK